jgi:hypothetical protein
MLHARFEGTAWSIDNALGLCIFDDTIISKGAKSNETFR